MAPSWNLYFKLGIVHFMAFPETGKEDGPILESLTQLAHDPDFQVVEIGRINNPAVRKQAAALLRMAGMTVVCGAHPVQLGGGLDINSLDSDKRRASVDAVKAYIDEAVELGGIGVALLSGKDPGAAHRAEAMNLLVESLIEISTYAKQRGNLPIVLETFDSDIDKKALIGPNVDAARVAERVKETCDNFGLMLDLSHLPLQREKPLAALRSVKDHLLHMHMGNCILQDPEHPAYGDLHPRFGIEGGENGVPELAEFLDALFEVGYLGQAKDKLPIISFEVKPMAGEDPLAVIANSKRTLNEAWALLMARRAA